MLDVGYRTYDICYVSDFGLFQIPPQPINYLIYRAWIDERGRADRNRRSAHKKELDRVRRGHYPAHSDYRHTDGAGNFPNHP